MAYKIIDGIDKSMSNETIQLKNLSSRLMSSPDKLLGVTTLFKDSVTPLSSILFSKGYYSGDLSKVTNPKAANYTITKNRRVRWDVKGCERRKGRFVKAATVDFDSDRMGYRQSIITLYLDTNWFSPKDVLVLADHRTLVHVVDDMLPEQDTDGSWMYKVKLVTGNKDSYIPASMLAAGEEIGFGHTGFEEMSETAYEKYTFPDQYESTMTIQRMKWSISGSASQTGTSIWIQNDKKQTGFIEEADYQMMRRWAYAKEYHMIFGRTTVDEEGNVVLKDTRGNIIEMGSGILEQGDGSLKFQYYKLTEAVIKNVIRNMTTYSNGRDTEVIVAGGWDFIDKFNDLMREILGTLNNGLLEGEGDKKGVNANYSYYKYMGIKFYPIRMTEFFDDPALPESAKGPDGISYSSKRGIFVSLGYIDDNSNKPNIELLALGNRAVRKGMVNGIDKGGDMASSVGGSHNHILSETGVAVRDPKGVAELYPPYPYM